ncbi:MAG: DUF1440 domain-containing protein [Pyrinomonadaceae bacterium]
MKARKENSDLIKGLAAGIVGGLAASVTMNQFQKMFSGYITGDKKSHGAQSLQQGAPHRGAGEMLENRGTENEKDDSAERLTNVISVELFGHKPTAREKDLGGTALHYAYGISMGAIYGAAAEISDKATIGAGMPYGFLIWLGADEGVVPLLGLSKHSGEYPFSVHAGAFSAHLVYGLTTEIVRRAVRKIL